MTFNELAPIALDGGNNAHGRYSLPKGVLFDVACVLNNANRGYCFENTSPKGSNYLQDFLAVHGNEEVRPISFFGGSPTHTGRGIVKND